VDIETIGVLGAGDMGSGVGAALTRSGYEVVTVLAGRSAHTRTLAEQSGMRDVESLDRLVDESQLLLSILPPAVAANFAATAFEAIVARNAGPVFADCNAVSPATLDSMSIAYRRAGRPFVDVGIVGRPPPADGGPATRFYVSGPDRSTVLELDVSGIDMIDMGERLGRASAIKMVYASLNKGVDALLTAVLLAGERLGVRDELMSEFEQSQSVMLTRMRARIPYLAATAERFVPEMREIAATFADSGVTPAFHDGAAWVFEQLAQTPLAGETRASLPESRSLEEALSAFAAVVDRDVPQ